MHPAALEVAVGIGERHVPARRSPPLLPFPVELGDVALVLREHLAAVADHGPRLGQEFALRIIDDEAVQRLQRLPHRRQVLLVAGRQQENLRGAVVEIGGASAERRVIGLRMRGMALDEILVERGGSRPVVALEGHVGDGELREGRILRIREVVAHVLEVAGCLQRILILLFLHALLVRLGGVARLGTGNGLGDVDAGVASGAGAGRQEKEHSKDHRSRHGLPIRFPALSPPPRADGRSRTATGADAASRAYPPACGLATAVAARAGPTLPRRRLAPPPRLLRAPLTPRRPAPRASSPTGAERLRGRCECALSHAPLPGR